MDLSYFVAFVALFACIITSPASSDPLRFKRNPQRAPRPVGRPDSLGRPVVRVPPTQQEQAIRQRNEVVSRVFEAPTARQVSQDDDIQEPLGLSSGAFALYGNLRSSFSCNGQVYGYYADLDTDCRVFHICLPVTYPDGRAETLQWSFFCGNQTVFDQSQLACVHAEDAIPCRDSTQWLYRNDDFGVIPEGSNSLVNLRRRP